MSSSPHAGSVSPSVKFASISTAALMCCVLLSLIFDWAELIAGAAALIMLVGAVLVASSRTRMVVAILVGIGLACAILSISLFHSAFELNQLRRLNQDLVAMLAGGAFIRGIVTSSKRATAPKLTGVPAVLRTAYVSHFIASVLNFVSLGLVGDHLQRGGRLTLNNAALLSQSFVLGALWSPFWSVSALVVIYFPTVALLPVSVTGLAFALLLLAVVSLWNFTRRSPKERLEQGYPLQPQTLALPLVLIVVVVTGHLLLPEAPVPRLVLLASVAIPFVLGTLRKGIVTTAGQFVRVAAGGLTASSNEFALFIAAGIFTVGGSMLTAHLPFQLSSLPPTVLTAWLLCIAIVLLSMVGVHPIISISVAAAMAMFVSEGGALYAAAVLWGWCLASPVGPLAGTTIFISGRFGVRGRDLIVANIPFTLVGVALAYPAIYLANELTTAWGLG
ncbi:MAG: hypothetical protein ACTIJ6_01445 [Leucobacter sp.]